MKISPELETAFNEQITLEFEASMVYRQLAIIMDQQDLTGAATWLRHQADEEIVHANSFIDHLTDRGNRATIGALPAPEVSAETMLDVFRAAQAHEEKVSAAIRALVRAAEAAHDVDSRPLLNWFLDEQIEEEATVGEIVGRLELIGKDGAGMIQIDEQLGRRQ